ncbi:ubiquitin carboxyl-terminal hydrolase MINDY-1 [Lingula anatina]|uniref:Ubiquitin carboxyl-terminal hydrolase n=1 Tax=Lingula anatina TaxID=7574 RepID=A0A1S3IZ87_LINAN|nr:ubiquitin carboxyl-terminal hydrolase MINDY-1 [Lingula anatina]XP_013403327.1 ubiquitin carboxyl-terminal hydrolase MINDY-1 [Lingula anatina]XP_013403328.1 ubiquitin carboxyl-terminal hydrolase MINDY-1 [Lingula anatina]|eukprot:XP_013403326.1 ubiquitin carboxyl-terminal hydrolase MINDY-1 [Lingula anatina]
MSSEKEKHTAHSGEQSSNSVMEENLAPAQPHETSGEQNGVQQNTCAVSEIEALKSSVSDTVDIATEPSEQTLPPPPPSTNDDSGSVPVKQIEECEGFGSVVTQEDESKEPSGDGAAVSSASTADHTGHIDQQEILEMFDTLSTSKDTVQLDAAVTGVQENTNASFSENGNTKDVTLSANEKLVVNIPCNEQSQLTKSENVAMATVDKESQEGATAAEANGDQKTPLQSIYHLKWIQFKGKKIGIVTQNDNGPCPLISIINVLSLRNKLKFPAMMEIVTSGQLMEYLGDCVFEQAPKNISESAQLNYEQNMHDAMSVFHKLQTGLDVNVKFTGVRDFEYTPECIVFDLLNILLYHGWLPDPESPEILSAVGNLSYNQLVEKIITQKASDKEELVTEALIAENFLTTTASQLTYHGLCELLSTLKDDELAVMFRNNHFGTIYKKQNELFVLVTDQGFLTESNVVWETLSNVEGDCHFVNCNFVTYRKAEMTQGAGQGPAKASPENPESQVDHDYLVALSLQQDQADQLPASTWSPGQESTEQTDLQLAMQLQEEENRRADSSQQRRDARRQQQMQQNQLHLQRQFEAANRERHDTEHKKKDDKCILL